MRRKRPAIPGRAVNGLAIVFGALHEHMCGDTAGGKVATNRACGCSFRPFQPLDEIPDKPPVVVDEPVRARRTYRNSRARVA
jgi:hypothetical protein